MKENNILLANFLDLDLALWSNEEIENFHTNWNFLMRVVEKIETTSYNVPLKFQQGFMQNTKEATGSIDSVYDEREEFKGWSSYAEIGTKTIWDSTMLGEGFKYASKIEAVYNACVEFVKWNRREMEENKNLLADFLGLEKQLHLYENPISGEYEEDVRFDKDWNWLMMVVDRIETLDIVESLRISTDNILIRTYKGDYKLDFWVNGYTKIDAVYESCVDFIKWYNKNKNNYVIG